MYFDTHTHTHFVMLWGLSKFTITVYKQKEKEEVTAKLEPCIEFQKLKEKKDSKQRRKRLKEIRVVPLLSPLFLYYKNELILKILSDYSD